MLSLFRYHGSKKSNKAALPEYTAAAEPSHADGLYSDASTDDYESAEQFCLSTPLYPPSLLPTGTIDSIRKDGAKAWSLRYPRMNGKFRGTVEPQKDGTTRVSTQEGCFATPIFSNIPLLAGMYHPGHSACGIYYELKVLSMKGVIVIGTACLPYPDWRLPGWNRLSAGLHLDDGRKFFEDPNGGRDYLEGLTVHSGDVFGCGYEHETGNLFFTYNGRQLPSAFMGQYRPRSVFDVYAAVGVEGKNDLTINFGAEPFAWKAGNLPEWSLASQFEAGLAGGSAVPGAEEDVLPTYDEARLTRT